MTKERKIQAKKRVARRSLVNISFDVDDPKIKRRIRKLAGQCKPPLLLARYMSELSKYALEKRIVFKASFVASSAK